MVRELVIWPEPVLTTRARPVQVFNATLEQLFDEMAVTMVAARGVGLAAPQIGVALRLYVIDIGEEGPGLVEFANPEIIRRSGRITEEEGCLSVPGESAPVTRASEVTVRAWDRRGQTFELSGTGLLARALQHEQDHIDGKVYVDHLSGLRREQIHKAMLKIKLG